MAIKSVMKGANDWNVIVGGKIDKLLLERIGTLTVKKISLLSELSDASDDKAETILIECENGTQLRHVFHGDFKVDHGAGGDHS